MERMERIYYDINEDRARVAHEMMSFREFKPGVKTAEYKADVDSVYDLADKVAALHPDDAERAYKLAERYSRRLAANMNKDFEIGTRCPSVMISGGSNFPVRKKEKQVAAWEANNKDYMDIQNIKVQLKRLIRGNSAIKSDDADAVGKLERKIDKLRNLQEQMKAANRALRMKDTAAGDRKLSELGYDEDQIKQLREPDFCGRIGYADYALANNNANIHRLENRLKDLKSVKEKGTETTETDLFKVVENTEIMRLQIVFDGKPEPEVRDVLKRNGFKWAPSKGAWQRQLNDNSRRALNTVIRELTK